MQYVVQIMKMIIIVMMKYVNVKMGKLNILNLMEMVMQNFVLQMGKKIQMLEMH